MSALLLFDIDGTLLLSGGAGVRSMNLAFERVFGVADAFAGVPVAGHTDTWLVSRALERAGLADTPEVHAAFRSEYLSILPEQIQQRGVGRKEVMPGVPQLLGEVARSPRLHAALLTGNYAQAAAIKLRYFDLHDYFDWGAFGEEAADRNALACLAVARAAERGLPREARDNAVVIGDTPHDIACARAAGARVIAVATGGSTIEELEAAGADAVLEDLRDTERVLRLL